MQQGCTRWLPVLALAQLAGACDPDMGLPLTVPPDLPGAPEPVLDLRPDRGSVDGSVDLAMADRAVDPPPPDRCANSIPDPGEADVDCGGTCPQRCLARQRCVVDGDCVGSMCRAG